MKIKPTSYRYFCIVILILLSACGTTPSATIPPTSSTVSPTSAAISVVVATKLTPSPAEAKLWLDFDHPRLHEIVGDKPLIIDEFTRATYHDQEYVAVIVETSDPIYRHEMLAFQITDSAPTLIYDLGPYYYLSFNVEEEKDPLWLYDGWRLKGSYGFRALIENHLFLPILISYGGGNCYDCASMKLISINEKGEAADITPYTNFTPKGFVEVGGVRFRVAATQYYEWSYGACDHVSSPFAFRLYGWNGKTYVDVSKNEKEFYDQKISELVSQLQETWRQPFHSCWAMPTLANIFFDYESSGRAEYGWEQIKSLGDLSHWDIKNTPPEDLKTHQEVFDELEQRLKAGKP